MENKIKKFEEFVNTNVSQINNDDLGKFEEYGKHNISEMATFGGGKWGKNTYKAAVHGASTKDRPNPHIHIYMANETNYEKPIFNFEVSIGDLVSKDEINLIFQLDRAKHIKRTNRDECSWEGYATLLKGFREFLFQKPSNKRDSGFKDNLDKAIHQWNSETIQNYAEQGVNPMKEYFEKHNIQIMNKYKDYFED